MQRPWNRPSLPVYSVSTLNGEKGNMNIATYVTAISMHPKRYIVGLYKNTKTLANVQAYPNFLLQLLSADQYKVVKLLGQTSGFQHDKLQRLREPLSTFHAFPYLANSCAIVLCKVISSTDAGDHIAFLCDVTAYKNLNDFPILTTGLLREKKIIRA
jgi:flavin reductase (DIM6/NTAB) family NADH-FMN oxidoreductase RutF